MNLTLKVWRQKNASEPGKLVNYEAKNISSDMSFWRCWTSSMKS